MTEQKKKAKELTEKEYMHGYKCNTNGEIFSKYRKLKQSKRAEYLCVTISHKNNRVTYYSHRIIAETFIPNPNNKPQVNHINGIKTDNRVENLEWCTSKENIFHSIKNGFHIFPPKNRADLSKPVRKYTINGDFLKQFPSMSEAARESGLKVNNISLCCKGGKSCKSTGGFKWEKIQ